MCPERTQGQHESRSQFQRQFTTVALLAFGCGRTPVDLPPCGDDSYAVHVVDYDPRYNGGLPPARVHFSDPDDALGEPDYTGGSDGHGAVSLGHGGLLRLSFGECVISNTGDSRPELIVHEVGGNVERAFISLLATFPTAQVLDPDWPTQGQTVPVGTLEGLIQEVDVDAAFPGHPGGALQFMGIQIVDDPNQGNTVTPRPGADIDAVVLMTAALETNF
jgi:hypothetical protein